MTRKTLGDNGWHFQATVITCRLPSVTGHQARSANTSGLTLCYISINGLINLATATIGLITSIPVDIGHMVMVASGLLWAVVVTMVVAVEDFSVNSRNFTVYLGRKMLNMDIPYLGIGEMALRWGIASAGKISHDFVTALGTLPASDHLVTAVAAQDLSRAQDFATLHKIPVAYLGYAALAKDPNIDIVYIGNLITQHCEVSKLMLENGKHVLCEKPLCINQKEVQILVDLARSKKLFLMEAVWARFFPAYVELRNLVSSGALGDILQVNVQFGVLISEVERIKNKELGGGTVLDLGIYPLQFSQMIFGCEPTKVVALGHLNENGVDTSMSCVLTYPNGGTASLSTHSIVRLSNEAVVIGTKGTARLPWFWCPDKIQLPDGSWKEYPLPPAAHPFNFDNSCGLRYEAEECRRCITQGLTESTVMSWNDSLMIAKLEDTIREQIGVRFPQDD